MKRFFILTTLISFFIAPGILAYLFYTNPSWLGKVTTNKGYLLQSPILLTALTDPIHQDDLKTNPVKKEKISFQSNYSEKWQLILWYPHECDDVCMEKANQLARIRLALGRRLYQVDQSLMLKQDLSPLAEPSKQILQEQAINVLYLSPAYKELKQWEDQPQIFVANPAHYIILNYPLNTNPKDLFHDINQLLKANHA